MRALLRGAGFEEQGDFFVLALDTPAHGAQEALNKLPGITSVTVERVSIEDALHQLIFFGTTLNINGILFFCKIFCSQIIAFQLR